MMQLPIGLGENFEAVIDLVDMKAVYFDGAEGEDLRREEIPAELKDAADAGRAHMLEQLSLFDDDLMEKLLEEEEPSVSRSRTEQLVSQPSQRAGLFFPFFVARSRRVRAG